MRRFLFLGLVAALVWWHLLTCVTSGYHQNHERMLHDTQRFFSFFSITMTCEWLSSGSFECASFIHPLAIVVVVCSQPTAGSHHRSRSPPGLLSLSAMPLQKKTLLLDALRTMLQEVLGRTGVSWGDIGFSYLFA